MDLSGSDIEEDGFFSSISAMICRKKICVCNEYKVILQIQTKTRHLSLHFSRDRVHRFFIYCDKEDKEFEIIKESSDKFLWRKFCLLSTNISFYLFIFCCIFSIKIYRAFRVILSINELMGQERPNPIKFRI